MQEYSIKRGFKDGLEERMKDGLEKYFDAVGTEKDGHYEIEFGSFSCLEAWINEKGSLLCVDTHSRSDLYDSFSEDEADKIVLDTNRRFRDYLEYVTGYNTKERKKKATEAVKNK
ncbi:conserved hypothetical protein [Methanolacinia petrolearia DSM 11571]|uniref:DUF5611 domain-containing protein n=1 Tax=Methanolacinia petrolearia (strain DSM 11571 / OCM 486 / SEBR 4847) TaxID=679926 RepID=E1RIA0_METP4|nr:DUF5611 family protein [Methanolacinia petrolearia]ADN36565.1 conserved hypothetical protein [Methanolacinia petrolearia DSM 11571]